MNDTGNRRFPVSFMGVSTKVGTMLRIKPYFASRNWPKANINAGRSPALVSVSFNMSRTLIITGFHATLPDFVTRMPKTDATIEIS